MVCRMYIPTTKYVSLRVPTIVFSITQTVYVEKLYK